MSAGRVDILVLKLGEALALQVKQRTGFDLSGDLKEVCERFIEEQNIPREPINVPMTIAQNLGLVRDGRVRGHGGRRRLRGRR